MRRPALLACVCLWPALTGAQPAAKADGIDLLVAAIERGIDAGDAAALRALASPRADPDALEDFVASMTAPPTADGTVKERDRAPLASGGQRLMLEILTDRNREGRVSTWRVDAIPPTSESASGPWQISGLERLTVISGLFRLALDTAAEYDVRNLTITAPDLELSLPSGHAFMARTQEGPTGVVLLGRAHLRFSPKPEGEQGQVRIFCGSETLSVPTDAIFIRLNPSEFESEVEGGALALRQPDARDVRRASQIFETYLPLSFQIDLSDLSAERWSLIPNANDFIAEITTRKFGTLTYARSNSEAEDISLFDRRHHKNIAVYASESRLAARGRFYSEDDATDYDVQSYDVRATFSPDRLWLDGNVRVSLRTTAPLLSTLTLKLADPLMVRSVTSPAFGRLLHLRVVGQNSVLVGLPMSVPSGTDLDLTILYGGRLEPQPMDREAIEMPAQQQPPGGQEPIVIPLEPRFVYSNRSYWYPQATVTDYATATMAITVPAEFDVVASGMPQGAPVPVTLEGPGPHSARRFAFSTDRPVRYLACVISRFQKMEAAQLNLPSAEEGRSVRATRASDGNAREEAGPAFKLFVQANPRQYNRARSFAERAADILTFYTSILGDAPYRSFTVALTESELPGGHSPAYFAILNQPLPTTPYVWQNDPVSFENYQAFFLAHEVAHQWWGQAVGWKNYHEQWLSEGFAQYLAALYAERDRGADTFANVLRQMRRWAIQMSPQGPVYLGYRLGHIKGDSRVFRALVYNKGAMVLHMLRRLIGDGPFFSGLREFYAAWRFDKAGTDDLRATMEKASGRSLRRFFDRWIFSSAIPTVRFSSRAEDGQLHVRFEQSGDVFDVPITVTVNYADGSSADVMVAVADKVTEQSIPLKGTLRSVDVNRDGAALAEIRK